MSEYVKETFNSDENIVSLFEPDTLVSAQYFENLRSKTLLKPEKRLMLAPNVRIDVACGKKWKAGREREKGSESTTNGRVSQSGSTKVSESGVAVGGGSGAGVGSIELVSLSMEQALW